MQHYQFFLAIGSEASLRGLFKDQPVERQVGDGPLEPRILLLQLLQTVCLGNLQPAVVAGGVLPAQYLDIADTTECPPGRALAVRSLPHDPALRRRPDQYPAYGDATAAIAKRAKECRTERRYWMPRAV